MARFLQQGNYMKALKLSIRGLASLKARGVETPELSNWIDLALIKNCL